MNNPLDNFKNPFDIDGEYAKRILNTDVILGNTQKILNIDILGLPKSQPNNDSVEENLIMESGQHSILGMPDNFYEYSEDSYGTFNVVVTAKPNQDNNILKYDGTIDKALTSDLQKSQQHPNLTVVSVSDLNDLISILKDRDKNQTLFIDEIKNLYISSHGGYDEPSFYIGSERFSSSNIQKLEILGKLLPPKTIIIITSCHTGGGKDTESSKKFIANLANILEKIVIANRSWGYSFAFSGFLNYNINDLKSIEYRKEKPNALKYIGESLISFYYFKNGIITFNFSTFKVDKEGNPKFMTFTDLELLKSIQKIYNNTTNKSLKRLFPSENQNQDGN